MDTEKRNPLSSSKMVLFQTAVCFECLDLLRDVIRAYGYRPAVSVKNEQAAEWVNKKLVALGVSVTSKFIGVDRRSIALDSFRLLTELVSRTSGPLNPNLVSWRALIEDEKADAYRAAAIYLSFEKLSTVKGKLNEGSAAENHCVA